MFDPNDKRPKSPELEVAGDYLLVMTYSKFKPGGYNQTTGRNSAPTRRANLKVIAGPEKGMTFYTTFGTDTDKKGNHTRWMALAEYADLQEAIDLTNDTAVEAVFHNVPFKAAVSIKQNGKYTNHDLERIIFRRMLTDEDVEAINRWLFEQQTGGDSNEPQHAGSWGDPSGQHGQPSPDDEIHF